MKRRRPRPRPEGHEDPDYLAFLRVLDCRAAVALNSYQFCEGPMTAAHVGDRGIGQRCPDSEAISLCTYHHLRDAHDHATTAGQLGFLASMTAEQRREWYAEQIAACRSLYLAATGRL